MRRRPLLLAVPLLLSALVAGAATAAPVPAPQAALLPVKCAPADPSPDGRVFTEPRLSVGWLRLTDFECGIRTLEQQYADRVQITTTGTSRNGHPVYDVLLTNEKKKGPKKKLLVVSSIHGDEIGAREGAARAMEDMLDERFLAGEPWVAEVLDQYVIHFLFPNPDGWVEGDLAGSDGAGVSWTRENGSSRDLNRNFPVRGWIDVAERHAAGAREPGHRPHAALAEGLVPRHRQPRPARRHLRRSRPADRRAVRLPEVRDAGPLRRRHHLVDGAVPGAAADAGRRHGEQRRRRPVPLGDALRHARLLGVGLADRPVQHRGCERRLRLRDRADARQDRRRQRPDVRPGAQPDLGRQHPRHQLRDVPPGRRRQALHLPRRHPHRVRLRPRGRDERGRRRATSARRARRCRRSRTPSAGCASSPT